MKSGLLPSALLQVPEGESLHSNDRNNGWDPKAALSSEFLITSYCCLGQYVLAITINTATQLPLKCSMSENSQKMQGSLMGA